MPALAPELEVLISTIIRLRRYPRASPWHFINQASLDALRVIRNGWNIEEISVARGHGLPPVDYQKKEIRKAFTAENAPFEKTIFKPQGPDIIARSHEGIWKIECKGLGKGKPQTHRNNFDRAVASAMSYLDAPQTRLGLALANDYLWVYNFSERLPKTLREATNLWVFLLENGTIWPYEPSEKLPYPGAV